MGSPRSGAGDRTRELLLDATVVAVARSGWSGVTTRQVAALAGVNPALVHYHFGSMAELRHRAVTAALQDELAGPMAALFTELPLEAALGACVQAVSAIDITSERFAFLYEAMLAAGRDETVRAAIRPGYEAFRSALAARIREAGGADPEAAAIFLTAGLDGLLLHRIIAPQLDTAGLTATLVAALRLPPARRRARDTTSRAARARPSIPSTTQEGSHVRDDP